jgi:hypothetical protein
MCGYNAPLESNHRESLYGRCRRLRPPGCQRCAAVKIIGVTEGCITVIQWSHTKVQRHLRNKLPVESNEVVEIAKLDAQKELLLFRVQSIPRVAS